MIGPALEEGWGTWGCTEMYGLDLYRQWHIPTGSKRLVVPEIPVNATV